MFKKILIANRGEIALRVIRACRELGVRTVAIYSQADAGALHVRFADENVCVGPADAALSYRNIPNILSAAEMTHAEAIHPGYGFLAENSHFAEVCESTGIKLIGPRPDTISLMGDKTHARATMIKHGIPVVPGSPGRITEEAEVAAFAESVGYPVIIKASAGGGGRGMRVVRRHEDLAATLRTAKAEAQGAFGDGGVYVEKYFMDARHVEVQVLADESGRTVSLGERDCSIQRRHQKLIEESPSPAVDEATRKALGKAAVAAAKASGYANAGTVEFLLDAEQRFYFMEMNTRIQVEHPVTEMVSGIDLVKAQIEIAAGAPLAFTQGQIRLRGHSIECRINAENPDGWMPSCGRMTALHFPGGPGVRVDSAAYVGWTMTPYYDSLVAKIIVHAPDRHLAIEKMRGALSEIIIEGIKTPIPLYRQILSDPAFVRGDYSTRYLEQFSPTPG